MAASQLQSDGGDSLLPERKILILYGSETGNSQDLAEDIERLARRLHFETELEEMNNVVPKTLTQYPLVIIVISTTGQGELPKNSQQLWKRLRNKNLPPTCLSRVNFTTFGLGDSSYTEYNWAAKKLYVRLKQLGANEFFPRGEADERHDEGIDGTYLPWSLSLRKHLLSMLPGGLEPIPANVHLSPKITLELSTEMEESLDTKAAQFSHVDHHDPGEEYEHMMQRALPGWQGYQIRLSAHTDLGSSTEIMDRPNILRDHPSKYSLEDEVQLSKAPRWSCCLFQITGNKRVTPQDHWQDVRALTLIVHPKKLNTGLADVLLYNPGDTLVLHPKNFPADVQALIDLMDWNDVADKPFVHYSVRKDGIPVEHAPKNCYPVPNTTLRQLLLHNYDITAIPKRIFFDHIKFFATEEMQIQRIREFSDPTYSDEFYDYTSRPRRSILEVLQEFSSVKIPYQWVPSLFPVIRGREYSIASGGSLLEVEGTNYIRVELLVALVKYKTVLRKTRQGLASRYIESLSEGTVMQVGIGEHHGPPTEPEDDLLRRPSYHPNTDPLELPVLAIAPGTGVAAIRSYFYDRASHHRRGEDVLFFGGRNRSADFFFEKEWEKLNVQVFTAFSRDQKEKIYVQDVIRREAAKVCELVTKGAIICLCGSAGKMPEAVRLALKDALVIGGVARNGDDAGTILSRNAAWEEVW
ncbi:riboflavin synthase domain-like protein [Apiospora saccharicola]|uniref:NADPH-dependent diflavin oxidoreductase 1 n=1 Tax=Apiospora saccharicola TaxID=335842 RepID=A0ABR1UKV5_9PEZI